VISTRPYQSHEAAESAFEQTAGFILRSTVKVVGVDTTVSKLVENRKSNSRMIGYNLIHGIY
jgi:hypothetical protein